MRSDAAVTIPADTASVSSATQPGGLHRGSSALRLPTTLPAMTHSWDNWAGRRNQPDFSDWEGDIPTLDGNSDHLYGQQQIRRNKTILLTVQAHITAGVLTIW